MQGLTKIRILEYDIRIVIIKQQGLIHHQSLFIYKLVLIMRWMIVVD